MTRIDGSYLRRTRSALGLTQAEVAERVTAAGTPLARDSYARLEREAAPMRNPSLAIAAAVLAALGQPLEHAAIRTREQRRRADRVTRKK